MLKRIFRLIKIPSLEINYNYHYSKMSSTNNIEDTKTKA